MLQKDLVKLLNFSLFFTECYNKQTLKVKLKINWTIGVVKDLKMVPEQYLNI
jgi:hypothetical protein